MRLEFVHAAEAGDHAEIEDAALARFQGIVAPHRTPAVFGEQRLEVAVEVVGIGDGAVDIFVAQHLTAHLHPFVVACLVHWFFLRLLTANSAGR